MIDKATIERIAKLAKLHISDQEAQEFSEQLSKALGYFDQISKVDTKGVEPLISPTQIEGFWREDAAVKELSTEEMMANAPEKVGSLFKVPPVV